jgi:hypothetical protein
MGNTESKIERETEYDPGIRAENDHSKENCEGFAATIGRTGDVELQNEHLKNVFARLQLDMNFFQQDLKDG